MRQASGRRGPRGAGWLHGARSRSIPKTPAQVCGHQALTVPPSIIDGAFIQKHHGGLDYKAIAHMTKPVDEPLLGVVARPNLSLVIPYRKGNAKTDEPLHTVTTRDSAALVATSTIDIEDCRFRMLKPREQARAQRFPDDYRVLGNQSEQTPPFR